MLGNAVGEIVQVAQGEVAKQLPAIAKEPAAAADCIIFEPRRAQIFEHECGQIRARATHRRSAEKEQLRQFQTMHVRQAEPIGKTPQPLADHHAGVAFQDIFRDGLFRGRTDVEEHGQFAPGVQPEQVFRRGIGAEFDQGGGGQFLDGRIDVLDFPVGEPVQPDPGGAAAHEPGVEPLGAYARRAVPGNEARLLRGQQVRTVLPDVAQHAQQIVTVVVRRRRNARLQQGSRLRPRRGWIRSSCVSSPSVRAGVPRPRVSRQARRRRPRP